MSARDASVLFDFFRFLSFCLFRPMSLVPPPSIEELARRQWLIPAAPRIVAQMGVLLNDFREFSALLVPAGTA